MIKVRLSYVIVIVIVFMVAFASRLDADDSINGFSLQTLDGTNIRSEKLKGMPMVINIGSHW